MFDSWNAKDLLVIRFCGTTWMARGVSTTISMRTELERQWTDLIQTKRDAPRGFGPVRYHLGSGLQSLESEKLDSSVLFDHDGNKTTRFLLQGESLRLFYLSPCLSFQITDP